ncbi:MAG TPA: thiamine phosphate synthase [Pseudogracilibacillus sp.]|nr:thiamine phosphate synthase [Pseudogracilibacillus sp.]
MSIKKHLRKYFIMGSQNCERDPETVLEEALQAGITCFQFREKGEGALTGDAKIELGKKLRQLCNDYNVPFIINNDIDLVETLDVDGIHVGQSDTPVTELRKQFPDLYIGLSVSTREQLENSPLDVVDYIGAGPVYTTYTKKDAIAAVGTEWISYVREKNPKLPFVGIGGVNEKNAKEVIKAGADGIAVVSAITTSNDIQQTVKSL